MNTPKKEDIKALFERFLDSKQARQAANDIHSGQRILRDNPGPEPDDELIAGIKGKIYSRLAEQKAGARLRTALKATAVVAVFVVLSVIGIRLFEQNAQKLVKTLDTSKSSQKIWESNNIADSDAKLTVLNAEVQQMQNELLSLKLGEDNGYDNEEMTELEMELVEISADFWKG